MVSIEWVVIAFVMGSSLGAILVALMSVNPRHDEPPPEHEGEAIDPNDLGLSA